MSRSPSAPEPEESRAAWVHRSWTEGRRRWPTLALTLAQFATSLARRPAPLEGLDGAGLYLAAGCLAGDPQALHVFEAEVLPEVRRALARGHLPRAAQDEVLQRLREKLLTSVDGAPRLARYSGRGPLTAWVRTVAIRLAADLRAPPLTVPDADHELLKLAAAETPELEAIRADVRAHFQRAFQAALAALTPRERALLRLSLVDHVGLDQLATMFHAPRSTAARWLAAAKDGLTLGTRRQLARALAVDVDELERLLAALVSRLDVSVSRLLREADA